MRRAGGSPRWLLLPLLAVTAFAVLLTFSLVRMIGIETDMRIGAEQNMLWVMHQSEAAARRLTETLLLAELGEADDNEIALRLDLLRSRIALLNEGPQRRFVERIGAGDELDRLTALLGGIEAGPPRDEARALRETLAPFPPFFARAANTAMITEWDDLGGRLEAYRAELRMIVAALVGIMAAGGVLTAALIQALRNARHRNRMLRQARDFSGLLIASSGEGIAAVDDAGRCTLWNPAMADLTGRPAAAAAGRPLHQVAAFFDSAAIRERLEGALAGESAQLQQRPLFRAGRKTPLHVDLRFFPMRDGGRIVGAIVFLQDASDRHAAERKDAETRERLEQLVAERTRNLDDALRRERSAADLYRNFAEMISHQFRTPLAIADSALQRLIRRGPKADADEVVQRASRARGAIAGLTRLVDSTLDAARVEAGQQGARRERCDLSAMLRAVCDQQRATSPGTRIEIAADAGEVAFCDPAHVEQVLKNLVSNAVNYSVPGSTVTLALGADAGQVFCDVRNAGPAIPEAERERIFERHFRGGTSIGSPGIGVGLFVARTLARMQGGDVTLLQGGEGTTFRLTLPRPLMAAA